MTIKFIPKNETDGRVRLNGLSVGAAFWCQGELCIRGDEVDTNREGEPYVCLLLCSGYIVRLSGDELVRLTTLEVREV